jgi:hypothetical protein
MKAETSVADLKTKVAAAGFADVEAADLGGPWLKARKPRPKDMDDWPQARHDASSTGVSRDQVGVPTGVRWLAGPTFPFTNRFIGRSAGNNLPRLIFSKMTK